MKLTIFNSWRKSASIIILSTTLIRLLTLGAYPLTDRTEARYGEIARKMAETGDWITPQIEYGVPFWGKPPLSTWLTAGSYKLFDVNDFSARLSSFVLIFLAVSLVYVLAKRRSVDRALISSMILATTLGFFVSSGAVMTDPALVFGTTLSMVGFWKAFHSSIYPNRLWGYLLFVGLAIGLLAKGPVSIVLIVLPIVIWLLWQKKLGDAWRSIPWLSGTGLMLFIALPWYFLAEAKTPGFINYFIVGEHWKRFTESGWTGDLYGSGHAHPYGTIWLYWLLAAFPWSLLCITLVVKTLFNRAPLKFASLEHNREWITYLLVWAITPMIFFTFSSNILWTYVLPGLPAFTLLMAEFFFLCFPSKKTSKQVILIGLVVPLIFLLGFPAVVNLANKNSQKYVISQYQELCGGSNCQLAYYFEMPYSAEFYSGGKAIEVRDMNHTTQLLEDSNQDRIFFVVRTREIGDFSKEFGIQIDELSEYNGYTLLRAH